MPNTLKCSYMDMYMCMYFPPPKKPEGLCEKGSRGQGPDTAASWYQGWKGKVDQERWKSECPGGWWCVLRERGDRDKERWKSR